MLTVLAATDSNDPFAHRAQPTDLVYKYDVAARTLSRTTEWSEELSDLNGWTELAAWRSADLVNGCGDLLRGLPLSNQCLISGDRLSVAARLSSTERLAFLVSAEEPWKQSRVGGLGEDGRSTRSAFGQHYLQLFLMGRNRLIGKTTKIAIRTEHDYNSSGVPGLDWLGGDDLIAVVPPSGSWLSVIHTSDLLDAAVSERQMQE
ncbi:MAG: hypothetical protein H6509_08240 [Bryobacterales bacterium]|nr:hypothetical protein [Acidobacteriota bacterium]MCB9384590.1 hypothetical protein [Bryobacterales bacterium]